MTDLTPGPGPDHERVIAAFLAGVPQDPAEIMAAFEQAAAVEEAELAARGVHPVSVVHGDIESEEDANLICGTLHELAARAGTYSLTRGGNDYTTWFFDSSESARAAVTFIAAVIAIAPPWWVVTPTAQPKFYR